MIDGIIHHVSINVVDLDRAIGFYKLLGLNECYRYTAPDGSVIIVHLISDNFILELFTYPNAPLAKSIPNDTAHENIIGIEHFSMSVDDIETAYLSLQKHSLCTVTEGRTGISFFFIADPDGNRIEIVKDSRNLKSAV